MNRPRRSVALIVCIVAVSTAGRSTLRAQEKQRHIYQRIYELDVLEPEAAEAIAWSHCPPADSTHCLVASTDPRVVTVETDAPTHRRIARAIAEADTVPTAQVFQVSLLLAERNGDRGLEHLTESARRALADARSFLPYTGYHSLGTGVVRTDHRATAILDGPASADYRCQISFVNSVTLEGRRLLVRRFTLDRLPSGLVGSEPAETKAGLEVLNTSFGMRPGETVIVGTSKLEGADRALVVLLTAKE